MFVLMTIHSDHVGRVHSLHPCAYQAGRHDGPSLVLRKAHPAAVPTVGTLVAYDGPRWFNITRDELRAVDSGRDGRQNPGVDYIHPVELAAMMHDIAARQLDTPPRADGPDLP